MRELDLKQFEGHTPGPWEFSPLHHNGNPTEKPHFWPCVLEGPNKSWVGSFFVCGHPAAEAMATAKLLRDAPLLLRDLAAAREENERLRAENDNVTKTAVEMTAGRFCGKHSELVASLPFGDFAKLMADAGCELCNHVSARAAAELTEARAALKEGT